MHDKASDAPDVIAFPPLIFAAGLGLSLVGRMLRRTPIVPDGLAGPRKLAGVALIAAGVGVAGWGALTFRRAETSVSVHQPAAALVASGPFRYTRNPIYLGASAVYSGITLLLNNLWGVLLLPAVLAIIQRGVIEREEQHLQSRFGAAYDDYASRVPRWLRLPIQ